MKRDYYEILGVNKNATADELKMAYRTMAKKLHPDINKDKTAEEKFKELNEAYEVLSDPQKRKLYDQFGHEGVQQGAAASGGPGGFGGFENFGDFNDIFGDMFENIFTGGGSRTQGRQRALRGEDLQVRVTLHLSDALSGTQKTIKIGHTKTCPSCSGTGAKSS